MVHELIDGGWEASSEHVGDVAHSPDQLGHIGACASIPASTVVEQVVDRDVFDAWIGR